MLKNTYSVLLLSAGLIVSLGTGSNTIAPEADLSIKGHPNEQQTEQADTRKHAMPLRYVALTTDSGRGSGNVVHSSQNTIGAHNWFPAPNLSDTSEIEPSSFSSPRKFNSSLVFSDGIGGFSSGQNISASGGSQGFSFGAIAPYSALPSLFSDGGGSNNKGSVGNVTAKEPVPAPEPATLAIMGSGFIFLWYKFLRKR